LFRRDLQSPLVAAGYMFTALWHRSLYGSTLRALVRGVLYVLAIAVALLLWPHVLQHQAAPPVSTVLNSLPLLIIVVVVGRQLGRGLLAREQILRRDAVLSATSPLLLGVSDPDTIQRMGWAALVELASATPELRILSAARDGAVLRVRLTTDGFISVPSVLPGELAGTGHGGGVNWIEHVELLDAAAGVPLKWWRLSLEVPDEEVWVFIGMGRRTPPDALAALRSLVDQVALAMRSHSARQELVLQARIDGLTGLANRATFTAHLARQLAAADSRARPLVQAGAAATHHILFLDLDDFKDVNDILGHRAGDDLLVVIAERIKACVRPSDTCARLGGDEFAEILEETTVEEAREIAQRMVDAVAEPIQLGGRSARVGVSVGIAPATPNVGLEDLIHRADVAMYAAKAHGKGRIEIFEEDLIQSDTSKLSGERQLAVAAVRGELVVHYQPILALPGLRCIAVEALVRWQHPERGLLQPNDFIEMAEQTGAITDIGEYVMRTACSDTADWLRQYPESEQAVHVNVSPRQLDNDAFLDMVRSCPFESGLPAEQLVLELTETVILNSRKAIRRLEALSAIGVQIAIDDFGTGYSCLTTLRMLPVNIIKLDRTYVVGASASPADRSLVEAIVQISDQLGIQTVAEGVHRPDQQRMLGEMGIDAVQGYLYGAAVPLAVLNPWRHHNFNTTEPVRSSAIVYRPQQRSMQ
jgi:diguanylate cyclase (GGDEF)-like protein